MGEWEKMESVVSSSSCSFCHASLHCFAFCFAATGNSGADKTRKVSPAFSFGARTKERKGLETPGPHYVDPAMSRHGRVAGPASTISGRPRSTKRITTPGPGAYATEGKAPPRQRRSPAYSMGARVKSPCKTEVPSPNNYKVPSALGSTFVA